MIYVLLGDYLTFYFQFNTVFLFIFYDYHCHQLTFTSCQLTDTQLKHKTQI